LRVTCSQVNDFNINQLPLIIQAVSPFAHPYPLGWHSPSTSFFGGKLVQADNYQLIIFPRHVWRSMICIVTFEKEIQLFLSYN